MCAWPCEALPVGRTSIEEIAFLLGYEDHHSLYRAYHASSGETPGMLRASS